MMGNRNVKCAKCGIIGYEDSSLSFHRFPLPSKHGSLKAKVWATFCFPNNDWSTDESLKKLHKQHKMLCGNHFDKSSFTSSDRKRLNKFAIPYEAQGILAQLRDEKNSLEKSKISQRKGLFKPLSIKTKLALTSKELKWYNRCRKYLLETIRACIKVMKVKKSKRSILRFITGESAFHNLLKCNLTSSMCFLLQSHMQNVPIKISGRRWTLNDKIIALGIYKKSSACYRLLQRLIYLPSTSSLKYLLKKIPLDCGITSQLMERIKHVTAKQINNDNLCVLAFDEMLMKRNLSCNLGIDQRIGNHDRSTEIPYNVLMFMAIGVCRSWKQPIACYLSGNRVTADELTVRLKEVLQACYSAGLEVVSTVCDMSDANLQAVNSLGSTTDQPYFTFEGHEIVTIFDPPNLLKSFRNYFMKYDIEIPSAVQLNGTQAPGIARWSHILKFYELDHQNPRFVFAPALTQKHVQPNSKQKNIVSLAAQVFSHRVAVGLHAKIGGKELPQEVIGTANLVVNMDQHFDAMNSETRDLNRGKKLLRIMTSKSPHREFFSTMKTFFNSITFLGVKSKPPVQDGWLRTLNAIERLFFNLRKRNIKALPIRRLNQDPLENCFACIRYYYNRTSNPSAAQFIEALKTSILTNFINIDDKNRKCLDDKNELLIDFKMFLKNVVNK